jgi:hypothetical protein
VRQVFVDDFVRARLDRAVVLGVFVKVRDGADAGER